MQGDFFIDIGTQEHVYCLTFWHRQMSCKQGFWCTICHEEKKLWSTSMDTLWLGVLSPQKINVWGWIPVLVMLQSLSCPRIRLLDQTQSMEEVRRVRATFAVSEHISLTSCSLRMSVILTLQNWPFKIWLQPPLCPQVRMFQPTSVAWLQEVTSAMRAQGGAAVRGDKVVIGGIRDEKERHLYW